MMSNIQELRTSGGLLGYRSIWRRLAIQGIRIPRRLLVFAVVVSLMNVVASFSIIFRDIVMHLLRITIPETVVDRARHRITRRVYHTKV